MKEKPSGRRRRCRRCCPAGGPRRAGRSPSKLLLCHCQWPGCRAGAGWFAPLRRALYSDLQGERSTRQAGVEADRPPGTHVGDSLAQRADAAIVHIGYRDPADAVDGLVHGTGRTPLLIRIAGVHRSERMSPTDNADVTQVASPPLSERVPQPPMSTPLSLNATVPVAMDGDTTTVNVTACQASVGLEEVSSAALEPNIQLVLFPLFRLSASVRLIAVILMLFESCTSRWPSVRVPCGSIRHCVPGAPERSERRLPAAPCKVSTPATTAGC